jgi:hypothetical protein
MMKKLRIIASTLTVISILALNSIAANAEWRSTKVSLQEKVNGINPKYWYAEGNSWATGWRYLDRGAGFGKGWFYFEPETGYAVSNGWHNIEGKWYLFSPEYGKGACIKQNTITQDYNYKNYYYINSDGVWIENPPKEIEAFISLLQDREKMIELGILTNWEGVTDGAIIGSRVYFRDSVETIELCWRDGVVYKLNLGTKYSMNGQKTIEVKYENGMFIVNGKAYPSDETKTTIKNIIDESGLQFDANTGKIIDYKGDDTELVIPSTIKGFNITSIGDYSFGVSYKLKSITIPNSITSIGKDAFKFCDDLTFNVESEQTKNLLIKSGIDASKIILKS